MRTFNEVGRFKDFSDRTNLAYATYASVYLDFCDDNYAHFFNRGHDIQPIEDVETDDESVIEKKFIEATINIINTVKCMTLKEITKNYPILAEYQEMLLVA